MIAELLKVKVKEKPGFYINTFERYRIVEPALKRL
tara:strand:- start:420 stop:524 length:105 start_codon:yes stop_codon:yes gene_type:complete